MRRRGPAAWTWAGLVVRFRTTTTGTTIAAGYPWRLRHRTGRLADEPRTPSRLRGRLAGPRPRPRMGRPARAATTDFLCSGRSAAATTTSPACLPADEGVAAATLPAARPRTTSATASPPACCAPRCGSGSRPAPGRSAPWPRIAVEPAQLPVRAAADGAAPGDRPAADRRRRRHRQDHRGRPDRRRAARPGRARTGLAVLCSPGAGRAVAGASCASNSASTPRLVLASTVDRLERGLMLGRVALRPPPARRSSPPTSSSPTGAATSSSALPRPGHRRRGPHLRRRPTTAPGSAEPAALRAAARLAADPTGTCPGHRDPALRQGGAPSATCSACSTRSWRTVDLDTRSGRELLARHFVQRRAPTSATTYDEDDDAFAETTAFPGPARSRRDLQLAPAYRACSTTSSPTPARQVPQPAPAGKRQPRVAGGRRSRCCARWPPPRGPPPQTLRTRSATVDADTAEEADELGAPASSTPPTTTRWRASTSPPARRPTPTTRRRRRRQLGRRWRRAFADRGPARSDAQARGADQRSSRRCSPTATTRSSSAASSPPPSTSPSTSTARSARRPHVRAVTGTLSPQQRLERSRSPRREPAHDPTARRVLVATDCLSEGVNLQDALRRRRPLRPGLEPHPARAAGGPGRPLRPAQRRRPGRHPYGEDNGIDGIVLDVLIRKHRQIAQGPGRLRLRARRAATA